MSGDELGTSPIHRDLRAQEKAAATAAVTRAGRLGGRRSAVIALVACLIITPLMTVGTVGLVLDTRSTLSTEVAARQQRDADVDTALRQLQALNDELEKRGQAPVQPPTPPDQSGAIAALVLAKVLTMMPKSPSAADVAGALQPAVLAALSNLTQAQVAAMVGVYFKAHPPLPGPAPSPADIDSAVARQYAAHPPKDGAPGPKGDPCLSTDPACVGPKGDPGKDGQPGPPVHSWSWPDPVVPGVTHVCTRSGGTDAAADYSCT